MRVSDYRVVVVAVVLCLTWSSPFVAAKVVEVKECNGTSHLPRKCLASCVPDNVHNSSHDSNHIAALQLKLLVRPVEAEKCKQRRRTAWVCTMPGMHKKVSSLEFFEEFPDWSSDYWKWRTQDIGKLHLLIEYQAHDDKIQIHTTYEHRMYPVYKNGDEADYARIYLEKVTNDSCVETGKSSGLRGENRTLLFDCAYWGTTPKKPIQEIYIFLLFIASSFLLMTVIVYLVIWDRHTLHGWTVFSEVLSNFLMIVTVGLAHYFVRNVDHGPPSYGCIALALISHFFFLSTFFWMTAINFNLWKTFRNPKCPKANSRSERRRSVFSYINYTAFAVGVPFLLVLGSALLDFLHTTHNEFSTDPAASVNNTGIRAIRPEYGKKFCYIAKDAQGHFIYYPIGTLIVINSIFFALTAFSLMKHRRETKVLADRQRGGSQHPKSKKESQDSLASENRNRKGSTRTHDESPTQSMTLFAKLFCIMGVSWVFEIFAWAFSPPHENVPIYWIIYDVTNLIQAIAVFVIFVCKRDVLLLLRERFGRLKMQLFLQ